MPLKSLLDNEFEFMMQSKQPMTDILNMPYWKFEEFIDRLNDRNDKIASERKKHDEAQAKNASAGSLNTGSMMNKFKIPKFK
jgi:hypothetical protein